MYARMNTLYIIYLCTHQALRGSIHALVVWLGKSHPFDLATKLRRAAAAQRSGESVRGSGREQAAGSKALLFLQGHVDDQMLGKLVWK